MRAWNFYIRFHNHTESYGAIFMEIPWLIGGVSLFFENEANFPPTYWLSIVDIHYPLLTIDYRLLIIDIDYLLFSFLEPTIFWNLDFFGHRIILWNTIFFDLEFFELKFYLELGIIFGLRISWYLMMLHSRKKLESRNASLASKLTKKHLYIGQTSATW